MLESDHSRDPTSPRKRGEVKKHPPGGGPHLPPSHVAKLEVPALLLPARGEKVGMRGRRRTDELSTQTHARLLANNPIRR
jgi:hypothetical protein